MQDKWMNIGYENDELKPYLEPVPDLNDKSRLGIFDVPLIFLSISVNRLYILASIVLILHQEI